MNNRTWLKLSILIVLIVLIWWVLQVAGIDFSAINPERIREFILKFGVWAPLIYLVVYGQPIVPLPASIMTITGGLAFGPAWGTLAALCGATARACSQFFVARLLGRETVAKLLKGKIASFDEKIGKNSFKTVLLIRLIPNLPFDIQNYCMGFSRVNFWPYVVATFFGMIPGAFAYVYLGYSLTDPKHIWKLILAIVIIVCLMITQQIWTKNKRSTKPN